MLDALGVALDGGEIVVTQTRRASGRALLALGCSLIIGAACVGACVGGWVVLAVYQWHL